MIGLFSRKGQSTAEYAILFAIVIAVISGMQLYFRRGLNEKIKVASDRTTNLVLNEQADIDQKTGLADIYGTDTQYEPYYSHFGDYNWQTTTKAGDERIVHEYDAGSIGGGTTLTGEATKREGEQRTTRYGRWGSENR
jgi:hypothetical protein